MKSKLKFFIFRSQKLVTSHYLLLLFFLQKMNGDIQRKGALAIHIRIESTNA